MRTVLILMLAFLGRAAAPAAARARGFPVDPSRGGIATLAPVLAPVGVIRNCQGTLLRIEE